MEPARTAARALCRRAARDVQPRAGGRGLMAMSAPSGGAGRRRGRGGRRAPMSEINVTPLVDVMLVLLIIFMITAPLLASAVPVNLPDSRAKPVDTTDRSEARRVGKECVSTW